MWMSCAGRAQIQADCQCSAGSPALPRTGWSLARRSAGHEGTAVEGANRGTEKRGAKL